MNKYSIQIVSDDMHLLFRVEDELFETEEGSRFLEGILIFPNIEIKRKVRDGYSETIARVGSRAKIFNEISELLEFPDDESAKLYFLFRD